MSGAAFDPYAALGVAPGVSDAELRRAYRELVKRHHPDHNGGSPESAARFEQIQTAYAAITQRRLGSEPAPAATASADPDLDARIAALERELAANRVAQARDAQARDAQARDAQARAHAGDAQAGDAQRAGSRPPRPTPEELGQYTTDDSFAKIFDDAAEMLRRARRRA